MQIFRSTILGFIGVIFGIAACTQKQPVFDHLDAEYTELIGLGKTVYQQHCAICHGAKLEGRVFLIASSNAKDYANKAEYS